MTKKEENIISEVIDCLKRENLTEIKPVALVGKINTLVQTYELQESRLTPIVQEIYIHLLLSKDWDSNSARQSWVTASGGDFEGFVRNHINETLNDTGVMAIKGDTLKKMAQGSKQVEEIIKFLMLPNKRRCTQSELKIWADNDVVVLAKTKENYWKVLAVISCKTSDHSRNTSVLFWSLSFVQLGIKYFLATQDLDDQFNEECKKVTKKQRMLFEAYCDRVFSSNPSTKYCSQIKSLIVRKDGSSELTDELSALQQSLGYRRERLTKEDLEE